MRYSSLLVQYSVPLQPAIRSCAIQLQRGVWGLQSRHRYNGGEIDGQRSLCGEYIDSTPVVTRLPGLSNPCECYQLHN